MQDLLKQKLPLYLLSRIWFLANSILASLLVLLYLIGAFINKSEDYTMLLCFATIFVGFVISSPSLLILIIANDCYNEKQFANTTIKKYINRTIVIINLVYLIVTFVCNKKSFDVLIFYILTTTAGLFSFHFLAKKYFINHKDEI